MRIRVSRSSSPLQIAQKGLARPPDSPANPDRGRKGAARNPSTQGRRMDAKQASNGRKREEIRRDRHDANWKVPRELRPSSTTSTSAHPPRVPLRPVEKRKPRESATKSGRRDAARHFFRLTWCAKFPALSTQIERLGRSDLSVRFRRKSADTSRALQRSRSRAARRSVRSFSIRETSDGLTPHKA